LFIAGLPRNCRYFSIKVVAARKRIANGGRVNSGIPNTRNWFRAGNARQNKLVTPGELLFTKADDLTKKFTENPDRVKNFNIRINAGLAAVAEARAAAANPTDAKALWAQDISRLKTWAQLDPASLRTLTTLRPPGLPASASADIT
jgi:hypothetical protein